MRGRWLVTLLLMLTAVLGACSVNPATGSRQFNVLSEEQEVAIGSDAAPQFIESYGGVIPSPQIQAYVENIGQRLAAVSERPDLPWEFHVVDSSVINAFALPGGKVFMSRGLLAKMKNEAQLAGVLGHEIGHVTAQHIGQQMSRQIALSAGLIGLGVAAQISEEDWVNILGVGAGAGGSLYLLSFGRNQESESDDLGLRYMTKLGYNPVGQVQVMEILKAASGGGGGGPEWLMTHPLPETRIERLEDIIRKRYPDYNDPRKYQFYEGRFQSSVLQRLDDLPPARHTGQEQQGALPALEGHGHAHAH